MESHQHQNAPRRMQFSKREIVSNWQKYELEPEEENKVTVRGEKMETLLSMTGEAMSHFRFRDELEWEDEHGGADPSGAVECLSLNPSDLAHSLSCLPIYQILDVNKDLFLKDQIESIVQTASKNHAAYCAKETIVPDNVQSSSSSQNAVDSVIGSCQRLDIKDTELTSVEKPSTAANHYISNPDVLSPFAGSKSEESNKCANPKKTSDSKPLPPSHSKPSPSSQSKPPPPSQALSLQDDDLDRLLDMDLQTEGSSQVSLTATSSKKDDCAEEKKRKDDKDSENLEEWLDTILD